MKIKEGQDFFIFDSMGKILAVSEEFYRVILSDEGIDL